MTVFEKNEDRVKNSWEDTRYFRGLIRARSFCIPWIIAWIAAQSSQVDYVDFFHLLFPRNPRIRVMR